MYFICIDTDKIWVGMVMCRFAQFLKELWPVRISFLLNILRMIGWNMTKFVMCIDEILFGIFMRKIAQIYDRVMALDLSQNLVFAQYLKNEWMEFNMILHLTRSKLGLFCVSLHKFIRVMALDSYLNFISYIEFKGI